MLLYSTEIDGVPSYTQLVAQGFVGYRETQFYQATQRPWEDSELGGT